MHISAQSCLTLCEPTDCSLPGSSVHGILQARVLEWGAISSARALFWPRDWTHISGSLAWAGRFLTTGAAWEAQIIHTYSQTHMAHTCVYKHAQGKPKKGKTGSGGKWKRKKWTKQKLMIIIKIPHERWMERAMWRTYGSNPASEDWIWTQILSLEPLT